MMYRFFIFLFLFFSFNACSHRQVNVPDIEDRNRIPQQMEKRENEPLNRRDEIDGNNVPAVIEERNQQEKRMYYNDPPVFD